MLSVLIAFWVRKMKIDCSRQIWTKQTNKHQHFLSSCRIQKSTNKNNHFNHQKLYIKECLINYEANSFTSLLLYNFDNQQSKIEMSLIITSYVIIEIRTQSYFCEDCPGLANILTNIVRPELTICGLRNFPHCPHLFLLI